MKTIDKDPRTRGGSSGTGGRRRIRGRAVARRDARRRGRRRRLVARGRRRPDRGLGGEAPAAGGAVRRRARRRRRGGGGGRWSSAEKAEKALVGPGRATIVRRRTARVGTRPAGHLGAFDGRTGGSLLSPRGGQGDGRAGGAARRGSRNREIVRDVARAGRAPAARAFANPSLFQHGCEDEGERGEEGRHRSATFADPARACLGRRKEGKKARGGSRTNTGI